MINLLLASTEGPTPDEIISGASEAVQEAVDKKVAGAVSDAIGALFDGLSSQLGFAVLYTVVALAVLGLAVALLMYRFKRDRLKDYAKVAFGVIAGLAIMATVLIATVEFYNINNYEGGVPEVYFKPALALVCIAIGGGCLMGLASFFNKFAVKVSAAVTGLGIMGAFIALMVELTRHFESLMAINDPNDPTYQVVMLIEQNPLIISFVAMMLAVIVIYLLGKKREVNETKAIVYGAIAIAMSFALSYAKFLSLPQGGSVTFASLLPLMIYCAMFGTRRGVLVCLIYGFLQALQDTFIIHPLQFMLDYPLAFGMIAASGIFFERTPLKKNKLAAFIVGATLAVVLRYVCHVCSGVFAFAAYADIDIYGSAVAYSFAYNSFTLVDLAIDLAAGILLMLSPSFRRQMDIATQPTAGAAIEDDLDEEDDIYTHDGGSHKESGEANGEAN